MDQFSPKTGPVLPQVRYHPSIQISQIHQPGTQTGTGVQKTRVPRQPQAKPKPVPLNPSPVDPSLVDQSLVDPSPVDQSLVDPSPVDRSLVDQSLVDRSPVDRSPVDQSLVDQVEVGTRGQSANPAWFSWRRNRITASLAHRIAHSRFANGKSRTPPASYLAAITGEGPAVQTRAMSWGIRMEAEAKRQYQVLKTAALGHPVLVQDCGLFLDRQRPWLAASPDGLVTDGRSGRRLLCLEVKCPYRHRGRRLEDACRDDPSFCLQVQDPGPQVQDPGPQVQDPGPQVQDPGPGRDQPPQYRLKTSHSYWTQVQVQMGVTGLRQADLVVFTLKEMAVVPVTFDPRQWEETLSKLETFYREAVVPLTGGGANCRPEL